MSQSSHSENGSGTSAWLDVLPALTLIVVVAVFSLQAISAPPQTMAHTEHEMPSLAEQHLPQIAALEPFQLTERSGADVDQNQLKGKVWVADFIFTSCTAECPLINLEMQKLQAAFADEERFKLVSFTVDPETDTPEVLRDYAEKLSASERGWWFLTGDRQNLHRLTKENFKLPIQDLQANSSHDHSTDGGHSEHAGHDGHSSHGSGDGSENSDPQSSANGPILHSQKFVLVDQNLQIRGYYDSTDPAAVQKLIEHDIPELLQQP